VDCDDTPSELELQRGPAAQIVHCDTTIEQRAFETPRLFHRDGAARTKAETMPLRQEPKSVPMSTDDENHLEGVEVADNRKARKLCKQPSLAISDTSETAEAPSTAVGSAVSSRTAASTSSSKREVLMPWEKSKWLAVGARPAMKATAQGSLRQVAGLGRLTGSTSSVTSSVASPQRRDQSERLPGGLTRQRNSNALHRFAAERHSLTGTGGTATPQGARCTRRRRQNDGLLREGGVAVASAPLLALQ